MTLITTYGFTFRSVSRLSKHCLTYSNAISLHYRRGQEQSSRPGENHMFPLQIKISTSDDFSSIAYDGRRGTQPLRSRTNTNCLVTPRLAPLTRHPTRHRTHRQSSYPPHHLCSTRCNAAARKMHLRPTHSPSPR